MNKNFVCFVLEGLRRQDVHSVWVRLGNFATAGEAEHGAASCSDESIVETRILPYYRVSPAEARNQTVQRRPAHIELVRRTENQTPAASLSELAG